MDALRKIVVLGTGHKSQVWLVEEAGRKFALKQVQKDGLTEIEVRHLFNEKAALQALDHPGIIKAERVSQDAENLFFLMKVASGAPLSYLVGRQVHFSEGQVKHIVCQVLDALDYMHAQGFVYRDLKLSNVFWDEEGKVTLVDLGFCKRIQDERTYTVCGTRHMMCPEIFQHLIVGGEPVGYSYEADHWALGILAYELMKGKPPFGLVEEDIYHRILQGLGTVDFAGLSQHCKSFVSGLLAPQSELRLGHSSPEEIRSHPWISPIPVEQKPTNLQLDILRDWCEFLRSEDEPFPVDSEDPFANF